MSAKDPKHKKHRPVFSSQSAIDYIPHDENSLQILHERAELIAKKAILKVQKSETAIYIRFHLGPTETYGIPYMYTKEVIADMAITKIPCALKFIAGVINYRGALIAVLDLKQLFFHQTSDYNKKPCIIIVSNKNITVGILADSIEDNATYDPTLLDPALPSESSIKAEYILGLHQGKTALINIEAILSDPQLQMQGEKNDYK